MRVLIVGIIVLALAVAGVSTYLIKSFGGEDQVAQLQKEAQKPKIRVLIAAKELRPGEPIKPDALRWQVWVEEALNKQFVIVTNEEDEAKKAKDFVDGIVRQPIAEGEPILAAKIFKRDKSGFLAGMLDGGMRAVSFSVSPDTAVAGFILPGDRVDVLITHGKAPEALQKANAPPATPDAPLLVLQQATETILSNVRVIAVNQAVDLTPPNTTTIPAQTVTLELTPKQAELLTTARGMGRLSLVLRSLATGEAGDRKRRPFTTDVETSPFLSSITEILEEERKKQALAMEAKRKEEEAARAKAGVKAKPPKDAVKIFRGGTGGLSEVTAK